MASAQMYTDYQEVEYMDDEQYEQLNATANKYNSKTWERQDWFKKIIEGEETNIHEIQNKDFIILTNNTV